MEYVQAGVLSTIAALLKAMEEGRIGVRTDLAAGAAIGRRRHNGPPNENGARSFSSRKNARPIARRKSGLKEGTAKQRKKRK